MDGTQRIDFGTITACGECCAGCPKKKDGRCQGDCRKFSFHRTLYPKKLVTQNLMDIFPYRAVRAGIIVKMEQLQNAFSLSWAKAVPVCRFL